MPAKPNSSEREDRGSADAERSGDPVEEEQDERDHPAEEEAPEDEAHAGGSSDGARPQRRQTRSNRSAADVAGAGIQYIGAVTGKKVNGATSVARDGDVWRVEVEVVEDARIPSSAEVLALYEATLDDDGELLEYRRTKRYIRGRTE